MRNDMIIQTLSNTFAGCYLAFGSPGRGWGVEVCSVASLSGHSFRCELHCGAAISHVSIMFYCVRHVPLCLMHLPRFCSDTLASCTAQTVWYTRIVVGLCICCLCCLACNPIL